MGKKCFVPNCSSGYRTCADRVPIFRAPAENARLELWRRAIPRADKALKSSDHVCAKHFTEDMISTSYYGEYDGKVILNAPKRAMLSANAVPSIFPGCPKYLSAKKSSRKLPEEQQPAAVGSKCLAPSADADTAASPCKKRRTACSSAPSVSLPQGPCPCLPLELADTSASTSTDFHRTHDVKQQVSQSRHALAAPSSESSSESKPQSQSLQSQEPTVAAPSSDSSSYTLPQVRKCQCCCHPVMSTKAVQTALPQFTVSTQRSSTLLQFPQAHSCRCCCHYLMSTTAMQTAPDLKQLASSSSQTTKSCPLVSRRKTGVQVHLGATIRISVASQTTFH